MRARDLAAIRSRTSYPRPSAPPCLRVDPFFVPSVTSAPDAYVPEFLDIDSIRLSKSAPSQEPLFPPFSSMTRV